MCWRAQVSAYPPVCLSSLVISSVISHGLPCLIIPPASVLKGAWRGGRLRTKLHTLRVGDTTQPSAAQVLQESPVEGLNRTTRLDWDAIDAWFEEDERVLVHPRNPYARVDAVRSRRPVRVELEGVVLAETYALPAWLGPRPPASGPLVDQPLEPEGQGR